MSTATMTSRVRINRSEVDMGPKIGPGRAAHDYQQRDPVVRTFALEAGLHRPASAHQAIYGRGNCKERVILAIRAFARHGEHERLARWVADLRQELALVAAAVLSDDVQTVDLEEDLVEVEYRRDPTAANARRWVAKIDRLIDWLFRLRAALITKHGLDQ